MSSFLHHSNSELIEELRDLTDWADQETAHETADEILVLALLRASDGDFTENEAVELVREYKKLRRRFG